MGGAGRPTHFLARELLTRGHRVLFVEFVASEKRAADKNFSLLNFSALGYTETALRRAWFGLAPHLDSRETLSRALDAFESPNAERAVVYGDPFVPFVEWFSIFRARGYKIVYDALDDFEAFPEIGLYFANQHAEKFLVAQCDLVIAVSTTLAERLSQWEHRAPIQLLRQGFDAKLFRTSTERSPQRSPPFRSPARWNAAASVPYTLGFWGHVNAFNIDVALIEHVARTRPQWTIQLIGPIDHDPNLPRVQERLRALPNVQLLGRVAHEELPRYLQAFDVALIPFPDNAFNRARDPLKVFEYLSGYKPVVVSNTPQLANMPYVYLATTPQEFLETIERAAAIPVERAVVDAYLDNCTWAARLDQLLAWLRETTPAAESAKPNTADWYADARTSKNVQEYISRSEILLDERTKYIHSLESDIKAKQAYINKLQSSNLFWSIKNLFARK